MYCIKCGKKFDENIVRCSNCGKEHPDASPAKKTGRKPLYASLSLIFLVISLCLLPIFGIFALLLVIICLVNNVSLIDIISSIIKITGMILIPPLIISLIFYLLGKE